MVESTCMISELDAGLTSTQLRGRGIKASRISLMISATLALAVVDATGGNVSHRWPTVWTHHVYRTEGGCYRTECWSYCTEGGRATVHIFTYGESVLSRGNTLYSVLISLKGPLDLLVGPIVLVVCSALAVRCLGLAVRR